MANQDPDARLDWAVDWATWLDGDTITASTWTPTLLDADPRPLVVELPTHTDTATRVWVSGGTTGKRYRLTNHISTAGGRQNDHTLTIDIRER